MAMAKMLITACRPQSILDAVSHGPLNMVDLPSIVGALVMVRMRQMNPMMRMTKAIHVFMATPALHPTKQPLIPLLPDEPPVWSLCPSTLLPQAIDA